MASSTPSATRSHGSPAAPPRRRVLYPLSSTLIKASDALPSNIGRSSMVHSLAYAYGLLDIDRPDKTHHHDQEEEEDETTHLLHLLRGTDHTDDEYPPNPSLNRAKVTTPPNATQIQLETYHSQSYLSSLLSSTPASADESHGLQDDCPRFPLLSSHVETLGGAVLHAAQELAAGHFDVAIVWDGGRHHAKKSRAEGFCYINDAVLAILELKRPRKFVVEEERRVDGGREEEKDRLGFGARPVDIASATSHKRSRLDTHPAQAPSKRRTILKRLSRILYLDLDLHWGDGVEEAFTSTTSVLTVSVHNSALGFYPTPTESSTQTHSHSLRIPLQPNLNSTNFTRIFSSCVMPLLDAYAPEAIVVQCGLDGLSEDPMNVWNLDLHAVLSAVEKVLQYADGNGNVPVLLLGGGGYASQNAARGWTALTALALGRADAGTWVEGSEEQPHNLHADSPIPVTSPHWPQYAPSYSLDVPAGHRVDTLHTEEYLSGIEATFSQHAEAIRDERLGGHKDP